MRDNARNMVKCVQEYNNDLDAEVQKQLDEQGEGSRDDENSGDNGDTIDPEVEEGSLDLDDIIPPHLEHMRCAAHTLQLAIEDGLKIRELKKIVGKLRNCAKEARMPTINEYLKKKAKKVAILDVETRWGSTNMMVDRLIALRSNITELARLGNNKLLLCPAEWRQAES